jgi:ABC-2 type transport system permease protein
VTATTTTTKTTTDDRFRRALRREEEPAHPTQMATFLAMLAREFRVMRRMGWTVALRVLLQPLLTIFVFSYVLPHVDGNPEPRGPQFSTVLVPGMVAGSTMMTGIMSVVFPLMMELGYAKEIGDRVLAPLPVWALGAQKIVAGSIQALLAGLVVFPITILVHAQGHAPQVRVTDWPLLILIMLLCAVFAPALGLFLGTLGDAAKSSQLFTFILMPATMLGCVYYPWQALHSIPWLQIAVLINPVVYASEALRSVLTPTVPHMSVWVFMPVLVVGAAAVSVLGMRGLARRAIG